MAARPLPSGTLTFVFTDVEGSTRLAERLGTTAYASLLERHRALLIAAAEAHDGSIVQSEGDGLFFVFRRPSDAAAAVVDGQRALAREPWPEGVNLRVRMGLHTGEADLIEDSYFGHDVNRAARIAAAGHGGQALVSEATAPLLRGSLPPGVTLRGLGEHRLKDLRPEWLCQLVIDGLPAEFPPIRSLDARLVNLPTQLTSFVGRADEVERVAELLRTSRLVTLTGPGGTGKTRLSLQVAAEVAGRFRDGVSWVPLAEVDDPALVAAQIATSLGLKDAGVRPPLERLVDHLREQESLLVLDNFEQVVEAAPLLADLLRAAPGLRLLVSSRIVLRVVGEHEYPVPPLALPGDQRTPEELARSEAVRLFVERARAVRPGFELDADNADAVAEIVERLDGLPLAIELAAARIRLLPPAAMVARISRSLDLLTSTARDLPGRQRTLRGAIAWSHDLLDPALRRLFARFAVFVGGASLEAAEAVCGPADDLGMDVFDGLELLVENSLLRAVDREGEPTFLMLATIREYGLEQLASSGEEAAIRQRHTAHYLALAETAAPHLTMRDAVAWLDRLAVEHDNLRAAVSWATAAEPETALRLVHALWRFWQIRGHLAEARLRGDEALAAAGADVSLAVRARALEALGGIAYWQGDFAASVTHYEASLAAFSEIGDPAGIAEAKYNLAFPLTFGQGDPDRSFTLTREAVEEFRALGQQAGVAKALWALGNFALKAGDLPAAGRYLAEALPILRELDETFLLAWTLYTLAGLNLREGRVSEAWAGLTEAFRRFRDVSDASGFALALDSVAVLAWLTGDRRRAARVSGAVRAIEMRTGTGLNPPNRALFGFDPLPLRDDPATAEDWRLGESEPLEAAIEHALSWSPPVATLDGPVTVAASTESGGEPGQGA